MKDERLMILSMLESGKITNEEAAKLLEALDENEISESNTYKINLDKNKSKKSNQKNKTIYDEWEEKIEKLANLEKLEKLGEEIGTKVGKFGEDLAEGATVFADKLLNKLDNFISNDSFSNLFGSYDMKTQTITKKIENAEQIILDFSAINGQVTIKTWDEDYIKIDAECQYKKNHIEPSNEFYDIQENNNKITIAPKYTKNISTSLDIMLPNKNFERIYINNKNGKNTLSNVKCANLFCETKNSPIKLNACTCNKANIYNKNSKILINNCTIQELETITTNSSIDFIQSNIGNIDAVTKNGSILCDHIVSDVLSLLTSNSSIRLKDLDAQTIKAKTSNAKIWANNISTNKLKCLNLYSSNDTINVLLEDTSKTYSIEAVTTNGNITLDIPNLVYKNNEIKNKNMKVIAISNDTQSPDIDINAVTSNASICISKEVELDVKKL